MAESSEFITGLVDRSIGSGCLTFDVSIGILGKRQFGEMVVWGNGGWPSRIVYVVIAIVGPIAILGVVLFVLKRGHDTLIELSHCGLTY